MASEHFLPRHDRLSNYAFVQSLACINVFGTIIDGYPTQIYTNLPAKIQVKRPDCSNICLLIHYDEEIGYHNLGTGYLAKQISNPLRVYETLKDFSLLES